MDRTEATRTARRLAVEARQRARYHEAEAARFGALTGRDASPVLTECERELGLEARITARALDLYAAALACGPRRAWEGE